MADAPVNWPSEEEVLAYRKKGLRPHIMWLPDTTTPEFAERAHRESLLAAQSPHAEDEQAFIDSISMFPDDMPDE